MEFLDHLALGFSVALDPMNLVYCMIGVTLGTFIGLLPGVGPLVTIAVLLPLTFGLPPEGGLIMLAGIYYGAAYGGSTTAILVNLPGESSSVVTCIDGYQMAQNGRAGPALAIAAIGSFVAGCFGTVLIAFFGPPLTKLALEFRSPDYFSLVLMALILTSMLINGPILWGLGMAFTGVLLGLAGMDVATGAQRFTFGIPDMADGIDFVVIAMGLFAFAEIISQLGQRESQDVKVFRIESLMPSRSEIREAGGAILRGTGIGSLFGILPGAGMTISSFAAYMLEKKISSHPEKFGRGAVEGVAAPESANNAAAQTAFIPTLTLGIPGSATMALFLGALMIHGIAPGPMVVMERPELFWGLIASMWIGNFMLVILNLPLIGLWVSMLRLPYRWLYPGILVFSCIGIFSVNGSTFDVYMAALFGFVGYLFLKVGLEPAPLILGFILGPMLEENFRRSLRISGGDPSIFINTPISATFLAIAALALAVMLFPSVRRRKNEAIEQSE